MPKSKKNVSKLKAENDKTSEDLEEMKVKVERDNYALKLRNIGTMLVNEMPERWRAEKGIGSCFDAACLKNDVIMDALKRLVSHKRNDIKPLEERLAGAEEKVSSLTVDLEMWRLKASAYEKGLKEIVSSEDLVYIKDKVATLRVIAGERCHCIKSSFDSNKDLFKLEGVTNRQDDHATRILENMNKLQIIPPPKRMPADTKLEDADSDLMLLVAKEMNQERTSWADWRMLSKLVNVECEKVLLWVDMQVQNPAQLVLDDWMERCSDVTVMDLYSHLISPAIRNTLLCSVIRSYYDLI